MLHKLARAFFDADSPETANTPFEEIVLEAVKVATTSGITSKTHYVAVSQDAYDYLTRVWQGELGKIGFTAITVWGMQVAVPSNIKVLGYRDFVIVPLEEI